MNMRVVMTTATTPLAWPTADDFAHALAELAKGTEPIDDMTNQLRKLVDLEVAPSIVEDAEPPSPALLGTIASFVACVELDLEMMRSNLQTLREIRDAIGIDDKFELTTGGNNGH